MKEHPIIFSGEMVRAILDGRKTQTRRVIKPQFSRLLDFHSYIGALTNLLFKGMEQRIRCQYGKPGDRLWVRETWRETGSNQRADGKIPDVPCDCYYRADQNAALCPWRPSIYMPRWASRITLEIIDVRVERVQDITNEDAVAEGCNSGTDVVGYSIRYTADPYEEFAVLWDGINEKRGYGWNKNPWVWVIEFSVI